MDEAETVTEAESQGRRVKANKMLTASLLKDDRFGALFKNPDFEIDKTAEEFRLINPVVSRLDQQRQKQLQKVFTYFYRVSLAFFVDSACFQFSTWLLKRSGYNSIDAVVLTEWSRVLPSFARVGNCRRRNGTSRKRWLQTRPTATRCSTATCPTANGPAPNASAKIP